MKRKVSEKRLKLIENFIRIVHNGGLNPVESMCRCGKSVYRNSDGYENHIKEEVNKFILMDKNPKDVLLYYVYTGTMDEESFLMARKNQVKLKQ